MDREERQIHTYIERFKRHIQDHLYFKPMALSNFHHMADRLLDNKDGCFPLFRKNIQQMVRDVSPATAHGQYIIDALKSFVHKKNCSINDFINIVSLIMDEQKYCRYADKVETDYAGTYWVQTQYARPTAKNARDLWQMACKMCEYRGKCEAEGKR